MFVGFFVSVSLYCRSIYLLMLSSKIIEFDARYGTVSRLWHSAFFSLLTARVIFCYKLSVVNLSTSAIYNRSALIKSKDALEVNLRKIARLDKLKQAIRLIGNRKI